MSFKIGLAGLNAAQRNLEVVSSNIANSNTVGFKGSRTEFSDVYTSTVVGGKGEVGGVQVASVSQQFSQGNITHTDNTLDLAINGQGFFTVKNNGQLAYSRAGYFQLNTDNFVVNNQGFRLQGYSADASGNVLPGTQTDLKVNQTNMAAKATSKVIARANLDTRADIQTGSIDISNPDTFTDTMAFNVNDSLGSPHTVSLYFAKTASGQWQAEMYFDGRGPDSSQTLRFNTDGSLAAPTGGRMNLTIPAGDVRLAGAEQMSLNVDMSGFTQLGADFAVKSVKPNGFPSGALSGIQISKNGVLKALYSNGQSLAQGQVVLADFANESGLIPMGDSLWQASFSSGDPIVGSPGTGVMGSLESGALEQSNVDISSQLVSLIEAQSNYQANAKTIETSNNLTQALMNII